MANAAAQDELPTDRLLRSLHPTADVNDFAGLLTNSEKAGLDNRCKELREKSGAELAVLTVKSLEGGQIDDFAVHLFKNWRIGEKANGVLLLVAIKVFLWNPPQFLLSDVNAGLASYIRDSMANKFFYHPRNIAFTKQ